MPKYRYLFDVHVAGRPSTFVNTITFWNTLSLLHAWISIGSCAFLFVLNLWTRTHHERHPHTCASHSSETCRYVIAYDDGRQEDNGLLIRIGCGCNAWVTRTFPRKVFVSGRLASFFSTWRSLIPAHDAMHIFVVDNSASGVAVSVRTISSRELWAIRYHVTSSLATAEHFGGLTRRCLPRMFILLNKNNVCNQYCCAADLNHGRQLRLDLTLQPRPYEPQQHVSSATPASAASAEDARYVVDTGIDSTFLYLQQCSHASKSVLDHPTLVANPTCTRPVCFQSFASCLNLVRVFLTVVLSTTIRANQPPLTVSAAATVVEVQRKLHWMGDEQTVCVWVTHWLSLDTA